MAVNESMVCVSYALSSTSDFSTRQYHFVTLQTDGDAALQTTAGGWCLGVAQSAPSTAASTPAISVCISGISKIWYQTSTGSTASIAIGDALQSHTNGRAIAATTADDVVGFALSSHSSGAAAALGEMLVANAGIY